ncbi:MAG: tail fiber protein [Rhodospirillaceae bacterium]
MGDYYIGEIRLFPYNNIPKDWHICDGTVLSIQTNAALYSLIGVEFGGDGRANFALPNLQGRVIAGFRDPKGIFPADVGKSGGEDLAVLSQTQIPPHTHTLQGVAAPGTVASLPGNYLGEPVRPSNAPAAAPAAPPLYQDTLTPTGKVYLNSLSVGTTGGGAGHENRQPYLALVYAIATSGIYPPRP